jgi:hypothetical protein
MVKFNDDDIGKIVSLEFNPKTNPRAIALGADKVEIYGKILKLEKDYLNLELRPMIGIYVLGQKKKEKKVFYSDILDYSFRK